MKRNEYSEERIVKILKDVEDGMKVQDVVRKHGIHEQTYYKWKRKYGGMEVAEVKRLKELEQENTRLKRLVAEQALDIQILKDVNSKKW